MFQKSSRPLMLQPVFFGEEKAEDAAKDFLAGMSEVLGELVDFLPVVSVPDAARAQNLYAELSPEADAIVPANPPIWGLEALADQTQPILMWGGLKGYYDPWLRGRTSFLRSLGASAYDFVTPDEAKDTVRALRTVARLKRSKIIYFGAPSGLTGRYEMAGVVGSTWNFQSVHERIGPYVKQVSNAHLLERADAVPDREAEDVWESWKEDFESFDPDYEKPMVEVAKLYLAIKAIMAEQGANAMTINCLADLFGRRFVTPCIALARLLDEGAVAGCEGDLNALLTMMLFAFTADEPSIMGNIYLFRPERGPGFPPAEVIVEDTKACLKENTARFTHDVIPLRLATSKYTLADYHDEKRGVTAYAALRTDVVATFGRIDPNLERIVLTPAQIERVEDSVHCRFSAWLKMPNTKAYVRNVSDIHSAMVYGDWTATVSQVSNMLKIESLVIE